MLRLRPSMIKFGGTNVYNVEICGSASRPLPMYLNRQVIKLLEDLGIEDEAFLGLQAKAVEELRASTLSATKAAHFLQRNRVGEAARLPWLVKKLWSMGFQFRDDYLLRNTMETAVLVQLRELKHRARILVEKGVTLYGQSLLHFQSIVLIIFCKALWTRRRPLKKARFIAQYTLIKAAILSLGTWLSHGVQRSTQEIFSV